MCTLFTCFVIFYTPVDGRTAFITTYLENEFVYENCKEIRTLITFLCDSTANWTERIKDNDVADATSYLNGAVLDNLASPCLVSSVWYNMFRCLPLIWF